MQSDADEAFARQLQEEMDALEVQHPNHKCPPATHALALPQEPADHEPPTAEETAAMNADEAMAQRLQAELYAEEEQEQQAHRVFGGGGGAEELFGGGGGLDPMQQLQQQMAAMMQREMMSRQEFQQRQMGSDDDQPVWRRARHVEGDGDNDGGEAEEGGGGMQSRLASGIADMDAQLERVQQQREQVQMMFASLMPQLAPLLRAQGIAVEEDMSFEQLMELQDVQIGADEETIANSTETNMFEGTKEGEETPTCTSTVCMSEFEAGEEVRRLPCGHEYHLACVDQWLKINKACPMCKKQIDEA